MWSELPTVEECLSCRPPFSFYFDLVGVHWKTPNSNFQPLHRICTLARKQDATSVVIESALGQADVREELDELDTLHGDGGAAEAVAISFFSAEVSPENIAAVDDEALLGQVIVINYRPPSSTDFSHSYVYDAVFSPPAIFSEDGRSTGLLNNYISAKGDFRRTIRGREFLLQGIYYCQQNQDTHVCAHACLRMALNSLGVCDPPLTSKQINNTLGVEPPFEGLQIGQVAQVIDQTSGVQASIANCVGLQPASYLSILTSITKSGDVALLVFTTADDVEHVVTVFGYTRNSDEWHPQAIPAYAGPESAPYYPCSAWIDHFLIHDDNFGPYYALSSRALETNQNVRPHWIIGLHPVRPNLLPHAAEALGAVALTNTLPGLRALNTGRWFEYITRQQWAYVLRTILIKKEHYIDHLRNSKAHDHSTFQADEISAFERLPEYLWMVEFSLPALYTGNRSKLGEVLLDAGATPDLERIASLIVGMRMPGLLLLKNEAGGFIPQALSVQSHIPVYFHRHHDHVW